MDAGTRRFLQPLYAAWGHVLRLYERSHFNKAYQMDVTSHNCDAPLDATGRPRPKYFDLQKLIKQHFHARYLPPLITHVPLIGIPPCGLTLSAHMNGLLAQPSRTGLPMPMEFLNQSYGFILYRWNVQRPTEGRLLINQMSDYALVYQGDNILAELDRRFGQNAADVDLAPAQPLDILAENMGRIDYGAQMVNDRKGITGTVTLDGQQLKGWEIYSLPLNNLDHLQFSLKAKRGPRFYGGTFHVDSVGDTFLDMRGCGKGHVWVIGHHLGRFWKIGPQQALYLPAPWLKKGNNDIVVFELKARGPLTIQGIKNPIYETLKTD